MSCEHQGEELAYHLELRLAPYGLEVLHDLLEEDMCALERAGRTPTDRYQALAAIERQVTRFRSRHPRNPVQQKEV